MTRARTTATAVIAVTLSAALLGATPARATDYPANPASLGMIENGTGGSTTCAFGPPRDVTFDAAGLYGPITDVAVTLSFDPLHDHVGDLSVTLIAPGATASAPVFHRTGLAEEGGHEASVVGPYTFSDSAPETPSWFEAADASGQAAVPAGAYRASTTAPGGDANLSLTAPFAASNPNGLWTLRFLDSCGSSTGGVGGATLSLDTEPPNAITFGKAKRNKNKGTATLEVAVESPGTVELAGSNKVKASSARAEAPGTVTLAVKAKGKAKKQLKSKGKAKVGTAVTFTPDGGAAATQTKKLKLVKK